MTPRQLHWKTHMGYGGGDFALNLCWQSVGFYLFYFFTDVLGLPGGTTGLIFLIGGLWDALSDPLMGYLAERTKTRFGSYRPYILLGAVPLAVSFGFLFSLGQIFGENQSVWIAGIALIVFRTAYTVVSIPYSALGARLTESSTERTKLSGARMYGGFLGGVLVVYLAKHFQSQMSDGEAFMALALTSSILVIVFLCVCSVTTREGANSRKLAQPARDLKQLLETLLRNKAFLVLFLAIIGVTVANSFISKTVLYLFEYDFGDRDAGNNAILIMTLAPLVTIPLWSTIALKYGKRWTWKAGCAVTFLSCMALYFDPRHSIETAYVIYGFVTLGTSAFAVLFWSMLPDVIDHGEYETGVRNESVLIGIVSSSQKASIAGAAFLLGILLDFIGYQPDQVQTAETLTGLRNLISLVPAGAILFSALIMILYPVSRQSHEDHLAEMEHKES